MFQQVAARHDTLPADHQGRVTFGVHVDGLRWAVDLTVVAVIALLGVLDYRFVSLFVDSEDVGGTAVDASPTAVTQLGIDLLNCHYLPPGEYLGGGVTVGPGTAAATIRSAPGASRASSGRLPAFP